MTVQQILAALKAECDAATPGPWKAVFNVGDETDTWPPIYSEIFTEDEESILAIADYHTEQDGDNFKLMASARTSVPLLIDALEVGIEGLRRIQRQAHDEVLTDWAVAEDALASITEILSRAKREGGE